MSAKQLGPQEVKSLSLYDREAEWKQLEELLTDGLESAEDSEVLVALVEKTFLAVQEKRDSFCSFLAWLEGQQHMGEQEQERLEYRIKRIESARKRLEKLAVDTIRSLGQDDKGKWKRLEGQTSTLSLAKNPASVEVVDDRKIPGEFKYVSVTIKMPFATWLLLDLGALGDGIELGTDATIKIKTSEIAKALKEMLPCTDCGELGVVRDEDPNRPVEVEKCMHCDGKGCCHCKETGIEGIRVNLKICPTCNGEKQVPRQVPGARLVTDKVRLVRK